MSEYIYATNGELVANIDGDISLAREEVVRCRDCKWFFCLTIDACVCERNGEKFMPWIEPDGFCSWGERR